MQLDIKSMPMKLVKLNRIANATHIYLSFFSMLAKGTAPEIREPSVKNMAGVPVTPNFLAKLVLRSKGVAQSPWPLGD